VSPRHEPVLVAEVLAFVRGGPGLYLDATLGDGGHAEALLTAEPGARLLGNDRDPEAVVAARRRLARFGGRVVLTQGTFRELPAAFERAGGERFTGALFDLGLSSRQIDQPSRGMSYLADGPLDLRMNPSQGEPVWKLLERAPEEALASVLREHGDLPQARRLGRVMAAAARRGELRTTAALASLVDRTLRDRSRTRRLAQVFQALRLWVNGEAEDLEAALEWLPRVMRPGGVVVTLAYHSGEDRRIKRALRGPVSTGRARRLPEGLQERPPEGPWQQLTRKVVMPSPRERAANPRSRSARLRAFRRKHA
jgi:16S rRNA (cytosine1402-N4)-methyltransferase